MLETTPDHKMSKQIMEEAMSENKVSKNKDLRIRRTIKLLSDALVILLKEKSFNEIYVTDICDRAMVHRSTFYKHFEDKYHLLRFSIATLQEEFINQALLDAEPNNPTQIFLNVLKYVLDFHVSNQKGSLLMMEKDENNTFMLTYHNTITQGIIKRLEEFTKQGMTFPVPLPVLIHYHVGGIISVQRWWLENNMPVSKEDLLSYIELLMNPIENT